MRFLILVVVTSLSSSLAGQRVVIDNPDIIKASFFGVTKEIRNLTPKDKFKDGGPPLRAEKLGYHPKHDWILHQRKNPNALPKGIDPAWQKYYEVEGRMLNASILTNYDGQGYTQVNPPDPSMDVGPNHVIQMVNRSNGSLVEVYDKQGNSLSQFIMHDVTNLVGSGDPIVVYDHMADRWVLTEFAPNGVNALRIMVSQSPDPLGSWYVYSFNTPNFPDYPKYGLWPNMYAVTSNEADAQAVYSLDRVKMLAGDPTATMQRFADLERFQTLDFQAATPVNVTGTNMPDTGEPAIIMRIADDGWATVDDDRLEMWDLDVDFNNPANSSLSGPHNLLTDPFDTDLCGFTDFSCIQQPGNTLNLDPLREVLMNKVHYRRFGEYEAIVCNHVTDVDQTDRAGVRWYELRRRGRGPWEIYQQGTYSPDEDSRWMAAMAINADGSIALAYNVSSETTFPSLRFTGRNFCDQLGQMTIPETSIVEGTAANGSNRYGDYNDMNVDPADGTFWFTGQYNTASSWSTRIAQMEIQFNCDVFTLSPDKREMVLCPGDVEIDVDIDVTYFNDFDDPVTFTTSHVPSGLTAAFAPATVPTAGTTVLTLEETGLAPGSYEITVKADGVSWDEEFTLTLVHWENLPTKADLTSPSDGAIKVDADGSLEWSATDATSYLVEVATDMSFSNIVISEEVETTSYGYGGQVTLGQTYYWRVTASNECGAADASAVHSFRVQNLVEDCILIGATDTPIDIPDQGSSTSTVSIVASGKISKVVMRLDATHTFTGDLTFSLSNPAGDQVTVFNRHCGTAEDISLILDDNASLDIPCPASSAERVKPTYPLSSLYGSEVMGDWVLTVSDGAAQDIGTLDAWYIQVCYTNPAPDCTAVSHLDGNIPTDDYHYATELESAGTVQDGSDVSLKSAERILLLGGFTVEKKGVLEADVQDCEEID